MDVSIVIRTYNEAKWLPHALEAVKLQRTNGYAVETVIVDSGSTDDTIRIAEEHQCRIVRISKDEFTFGRSLNIGCDAAHGRDLVFISGHCVPNSPDWLVNLVHPLTEDERIVYTYGRQIGHEVTKFSERQLFNKYFPSVSAVPQDGFFCNNANAAISKAVWRENPFDEEVTGLEDMELAKRLVAKGFKIGYVAEAPVVHIHEESWPRVKIRYEREAIALQRIMPEVHVSFGDFLRYTLAGVMLDWGQALQDREFFRRAGEIVAFRTMQYWGTYRGNNDHRKISRKMKDHYFYPR